MRCSDVKVSKLDRFRLILTNSIRDKCIRFVPYYMIETNGMVLENAVSCVSISC